jgi:hypothetical protein
MFSSCFNRGPGYPASFIALIAAQAAHSLEEYVGKLYLVFPPARLVSGLISDDLERGFVIANPGLVAFGVVCFLGPVLRQRPSATALAWFWVALETLNGVGHLGWSLIQLRYTPGVATAPLLLLLAFQLGRRLVAVPSPTAAR